MDFQNYIKSEMFILVPVLYLVGIALKKSKIQDKWIPAILGGIAIILSAIWVISSSHIYGTHEWLSAIFTAITQGILLAGASVYVNQLYIQGKKNE